MHRNTLLLPPPAALDFIRACRERGVQLLGFDAFRLLPGDRIQPIMDDSIDLSREPLLALSQSEGLQMAERFIEERIGKDILFEMVTA